MRVALFQPDIPQNTGAILRLAACLGVAVDIIEPTGFLWQDARLRRAGLDYQDLAQVTRHISWPAFQAAHPGARRLLLTTAATRSHLDFSYLSSDILLFGRESVGAPPEVHAACAARLRVPMQAAARSLNVAATAALALAEALRQCDLFP
jgi:tRNA (cytidine/uridine-2'-O-)-methyltransferase